MINFLKIDLVITNKRTTMPQQLSVMTYNVNHSRRATGDYEAFSWEKRKDHVYELMQSHKTDVILIQELPVEAEDELRAKFF
jgi:mRNA deadenylase 3'-5' endonuclease subunit Ccr4